MRMRGLITAGLVAALGVAAPLPADAAGREDWTLVNRTTSYSVVSAWPGVIDGRPGNWHLVWVGTSDDANAEGGVEDWTCPEGEALLDAASGYNPACTIEPKYWTLRETSRPVTVTWACRAQVLVIKGRMELVDNDTGRVVGHRRVHVVARGVGRPSVFVDEGDGYRDVTRTWLDTRVSGRVAGQELGSPGSVTVSNPIREFSSFVPA